MSLVETSLDTAQLHQELISMEGRLLDAILEGPQSVARFDEMWSILQKKIAAGQAASCLDEDIISLAHGVARSIIIITQTFIDVESITSTLSHRLLSQAQEVLDANRWRKDSSPQVQTLTSSPSSLPPTHRIIKPSLQSPRYPTQSTPITSALAPILPSLSPSTAASLTGSSRSASDPNPLPEFIEHAYKFFVTNIFNPYPTRAEKEAIVAQTNNPRVTFSSISNWFTNARRRCGWTTILNERCDKNREQLISLATRVFVSPDPGNPVDPEIAKALMEMKESVETMYERKTRTSSWIEELDNLGDLLHPSSGATTEKQGMTAEDRRREQQKQKEEREFERQKRKMQTDALRKAEKVTKMMQRDQAKQKQREERIASFATPSLPQQHISDEEAVTEPKAVAGGKRKLTAEDDDVYRFPDLRHLSPFSSRSSSFISDGSSIDGRVPSLTWSDSGDERPYKRSRSSPVTPATSLYSTSPCLSPSLEIPSSFDYQFTLEPPEGLESDPSALDTLFDFSVAPCETLMGRGKKRPHDHAEHGDPIPQAKRRRSSQPIIASDCPELTLLPLPSTPPSSPPVPSTPLFTPRPSFDATPTQQNPQPQPQPRKRSLQLHDLDAVLGLDLTQPAPVQIAPPDPSLPLDVGVFDWSSDGFGGGAVGEDFSQLMQLLTGDGHHHAVNMPVDMPPFDVTSAAFPPLQDHTAQHSTSPEDLSGLMSGLMSAQALHDMGITVLPDMTPDLSRESSVGPAAAYVAPGISVQEAQATSIPTPTPTPAELADKALKRARKRQELEEKRAALERERLRLAELERELNDDD